MTTGLSDSLDGYSDKIIARGVKISDCKSLLVTEQAVFNNKSLQVISPEPRIQLGPFSVRSSGEWVRGVFAFVVWPFLFLAPPPRVRQQHARYLELGQAERTRDRRRQ